MITTKAQGAERSLGQKYETTAFISEEGLRSDASMVLQNHFNPQATILDLCREEVNIEEIHYIQVSLNKGIRQNLHKAEKAEEV